MAALTRHSDRWLLVVCYVLWLVIILGAGWILSQVHILLLELSIALQFNPWVARAVRQLSLPVLGLFWLVFIFWLEHYFRNGVYLNRFVGRAVRISGATIGAGLIILFLRFIVE